MEPAQPVTVNNYTGTNPRANATPPVIGSAAENKQGCTSCGDANNPLKNFTPSQQPTAAQVQQSINNQSKTNKKTSTMGRPSAVNGSLMAERNSSWKLYPPPAPITLSGTVANTTTSMYFTDSTGLWVTYGGGTGGQAFSVPAGGASIANLHEFLKTNWIYVMAFNLTSTTAATLSNNLKYTITDIDGQQKPVTISSSANISNQQYNANLINNCYAFILSYDMALSIPTSGVNGEILTLTLVPGAVGKYGDDLADFISSNPRFAAAAPINCGE